ncbi:MAG: efflux RND transporter periplasmic adaptor subunit [Gammaproteobacteria bacterium]|nr:efflux RND transporter periplasmic adaptor subunit [Gammaproteobacteria bacterium]
MKSSFFISLAVLCALVIWMLSGQLSATRSNSGMDANIQSEKAQDTVMRVQVNYPEPQMVTREVVVQGQIEALQSVQVASETAGVVTNMVVKKGQRVKPGELLLELSMDVRAARQREAQALLNLRQTEHHAVTQLQRDGLQSKTELAVAEAQLEAAKAVLEQIELDIQHTRLRAPFGGVINDRLVELGDYLDRGNPALLLVNDQQLIAVGNVPQQSIQHVRVGLSARIELITGEELKGQISFVSATADANSRSFRIEVAIDNNQQRVAVGISGEIRIPLDQISGHFLSPAMLALNDSGELGVKAVDPSSHVVFYPVTIIRTTQQGAWVTGLPQKVGIITLGQGFVRAGDKVKAISETSSNKTLEQQSSLKPPSFANRFMAGLSAREPA